MSIEFVYITVAGKETEDRFYRLIKRLAILKVVFLDKKTKAIIYYYY